ncbi:phosphoribosylamine--glycine ligase [bacterium]|jgi:phosphoribosylamine---glycine ligase|nr:phosphoribosylamine--glycine ligase [bacterium]
MKVLLVGSGGREHALAKALAKSPLLTELYVAPGNPGTAELATNIDIKDGDIPTLLEFAKAQKMDLTFVGPEVPLSNGIVDQFQAEGLGIVGPTQAGAQLESSKSWAKAFMKRHGIPTAAYEEFTEFEPARDYLLSRNTYPIVIKADGLAAGKGVSVSQNEKEALAFLNSVMIDNAFSDAGNRVVIEDFLEGEEASLFAFMDGETIVPMVPAQDHKPVFDNDKGPNTGGMGAYTPTPLVTDKVLEQVDREVFKPVLDGMKKDGISFVGIVYAGLMIVDDRASIVEFNARFGDPETQVVLPRLETDLLEIFVAMNEKRLKDIDIKWNDDAVVNVVVSSEGYPGSYHKGDVITGVEEFDGREDVYVVHAGTKQDESGQLITNGGRVLGVVARHAELEDAVENAYEGVTQIEFEGMHFRTDIAAKAFREFLSK